MKKFYLLILFLLVMNFIFVVAENPSVPVNKEDVDKFQDIIDQLPFDDSGDTNYTKYKPFLTRAEERIDNINLWLDENVGWMRYLFHMKPQFSMLFAINFYFILFFFLIFVINGDSLWFFIESSSRARIFGGATFIAFAVIGLYAGLAYIINNFILYIWNILIPASIWLAIIGIIVIIILFIILFFMGGTISNFVHIYFDWKKKRKEKLEIITRSDAVNKLVDQITKK